MTYLVVFLSSLLIQFGSIDMPQTIEIPNGFDWAFFVESAQADMLNRSGVGDGILLYFGDNDLVHNSNVFMMYHFDNNIYYVNIYLPTQEFNSSVASGANLYWASNYGNRLTGNIRYTNYSVVSYIYDISSNTVSYDTFRSNGTPEVNGFYPDVSVDYWIFLMVGHELSYDGTTYFLPADYSLGDYEYLVPADQQYDGSFSGGVFGHSLGGESAIDEISNGTYGWSPNITVSGHSTGGLAGSTSSSIDYTNPEQNLLGKIVDNTNNVIGNLSGLVSDVRNGFSATVNSILNAGQNVGSYLKYLTQPFDQESAAAVLENSVFSQNIELAKEFAGDVSNSASENLSPAEDIIISYDLNPVYNVSGSVSVNSFLGSTKSTWQPLLVTFLYVSVIFGFIHGLPNLINGLSGTRQPEKPERHRKGG